MPRDEHLIIRQAVTDQVSALSQLTTSHSLQLARIEVSMGELRKQTDAQEARIQKVEIAQAIMHGKGFVVSGVIAAVSAGVITIVGQLLMR